MNIFQNNGYEFLDFLRIREENIFQYSPIKGSFATLECEDQYLFCYNKGRNQWEVPAGALEENETPKGCAIRELFEETGQVVDDMSFIGLAMVKSLVNDSITYYPVYMNSIEKLQPFIENDETSDITLWDLKEAIGVVGVMGVDVLTVALKFWH